LLKTFKAKKAYFLFQIIYVLHSLPFTLLKVMHNLYTVLIFNWLKRPHNQTLLWAQFCIDVPLLVKHWLFANYVIGLLLNLSNKEQP